MKKAFALFLVLFFLVTIKLYSQDTDLPFKATIALGPSIPVGKFTKTVPDSNTIQSAALPGPSVTFSFSYKFSHSHFGVELMGGWQQNDVNDSAIARSLGGHLPPGSQIGVWSDNWHIWKLLIGPTFQIPLTKKGRTNFECAILGGILKTSIPGYGVGVFYDNPPTASEAFTSKIPLSNAFCYQVNADINYKITRALCLTYYLSFMHATPVHTYNYYSDPPYFILPPTTVHQAYPISSFNMLVGIGYAL